MRGDLHLAHRRAATASDSLLDGVAAAQARGHEYLAITDHSAGVGMGIGLEPDDVRRQIEAVPRVRARRSTASTCSPASRSTSWATASLYLPDDLLAELDWVVASLHVAPASGPPTA